MRTENMIISCILMNSHRTLQICLEFLKTFYESMAYYKFALILLSKRAMTIVIYYKFSTCILVLLTIKIIQNWRSSRMFSLKNSLYLTQFSEF